MGGGQTVASAPDALVFLNEHGRAYEMWKQMMRAGEHYIKSRLQESYRPAGVRLPVVPAPVVRSR